MERDGVHMKDGVGRNPREPKLQIPWDYSDRPCIIGGGGFSWPPRSYTCSFCKREFRSAQALGGHMNVHRRDRARLRQSPPWAAQDSIPPNPNPNPKPENPNSPKPTQASSSPSSRPYPITYAFPNLLSSPSSLACFSPSPASTSSSSDTRISEMVLPPLAPLLGPLLSEGHGSRTREEDAVDPVKLDLEIGLCGNPTIGDLDLELRLGYS
ncbi:hypothetical protein ACLOJK_015469 [Asimina triloba]